MLPLTQQQQQQQHQRCSMRFLTARINLNFSSVVQHILCIYFYSCSVHYIYFVPPADNTQLSSLHVDQSLFIAQVDKLQPWANA